MFHIFIFYLSSCAHDAHRQTGQHQLITCGKKERRERERDEMGHGDELKDEMKAEKGEEKRRRARQDKSLTETKNALLKHIVREFNFKD